ncbi:MAG: hypothetical protein AB1638_08905, partial [Nitrospirota bacterium]
MNTTQFLLRSAFSLKGHADFTRTDKFPNRCIEEFNTDRFCIFSITYNNAPGSSMASTGGSSRKIRRRTSASLSYLNLHLILLFPMFLYLTCPINSDNFLMVA